MKVGRKKPRLKVFLSHSDRDRPFVSRLARLLEDRGISVWYSRTKIKGAQEWHDEIGKALAQCNWFVLVLTPSSVASGWTKRELMYALQQKRYRNHIVPLIRKTCRHRRLSWTLASIQMIDFTRAFDDGARALLATWGIPYPKG